MFLLPRPACSASSRHCACSSRRSRDKPRAPFVNMSAGAALQRLLQRFQHGKRSRGDRQVGGEAAHRIARIERVLADLHDARAGRRRFLARQPWHIGFDDDHQVGVVQQRARHRALEHRMVRGHREVARVVRDHRQRPALRQSRQHHRIARVLPEQTGDHHRRPRGGDPVGELFDVGGRRHRCARPGAMRAIALRRRVARPRPAPRAASER